MKKASLIVGIAVVAVAAIFVLKNSSKTPPEKQVQNSSSSTATSASSKPTVEGVTAVKTATASPGQPSSTAFGNSSIISALRAAVLAEDREGIDRASKELIDYINAHPDSVEDYVGFMKTEQNEYVLRMFTLALAQTEVGLLENDKIIQTAIDLAKDRTIEQRQHIMLHLLSKLPDMRENAFEAVMELSQQDPNSQVKTSAVTVLADWLEAYPDKMAEILGKVQEIFKTAKEDDVRAFTYQLLALHKESLTPEFHVQLSERLRSEPDLFNRNVIATALFAAPDAIRNDAFNFVNSMFQKETDMEIRRNLLAQMVCVKRGDVLPLLEKLSVGDSQLAQDARIYTGLVSSGQGFDPQDIFLQKAIRDAANQKHEEHKD